MGSSHELSKFGGGCPDNVSQRSPDTPHQFPWEADSMAHTSLVRLPALLRSSCRSFGCHDERNPPRHLMGRPRIQEEVCAIEGCRRLTAAFNRCQSHYKTWRKGLPHWPINHGTFDGYMNYHCRCSDCSAANTAYHNEMFASIGVGPNRSATISAPPDYWAGFKSYCRLRQRSMRSVALEAIETYMEANP